MRFMMLMYPGDASEAAARPDAETISAMMKYNEELSKAGVLLALDGLQSTAKGARVSKAGGKTIVRDGPFTEAKEVIGGYWVIEVKSKEEAVQWASRCPIGEGPTIEVRQVFEMADFGPDVVHEQAGAVAEIERSIGKARSAT